MPWCVSCNKFWTPPSVQADGSCPRCGEAVEKGLIPGLTRPYDEAPTGIPWHLKLLLMAAVIYLGTRFMQLAGWLIS